METQRRELIKLFGVSCHVIHMKTDVPFIALRAFYSLLVVLLIIVICSLSKNVATFFLSVLKISVLRKEFLAGGHLFASWRSDSTHISLH